MHRILIDPEQITVIENGRKKHHTFHVSTPLKTGDEIQFYSVIGNPKEVNAMVTYIDNETFGVNSNHIIFSFQLV